MKTKQQLIKELKRLNAHDLISLEKEQETMFDLQEKETLGDIEIESIFQTFTNIKQIKQIIKNRNELIDKLLTTTKKKGNKNVNSISIR